MVGSGFFLFLTVNALMQLVDRHTRQGLKWNQDGVIDAVTTGAVALFSLVVLIDAVRSFRRGSLGKLAFFGVLMVWSMVLTLLLVFLFIQIAPKLV